MPVIGDRPELTLETIVYATDFSVFSQNAGYYAALLAKRFSARLLVAHAFTLSQAAMEVEIDPFLASQQRKDLQYLLEQKAATLSNHSLKPVPVLLNGEPEDVLPELAAKDAPSIIVLGTHGGGWVERKLIGSVADRILRSSRAPSLTVGPQVSSATSKSLPFRRILYATDFTPPAARAAVFAVSFAEAFGADLDVLNVVERESIDHPERLSDLGTHFYTALDALVPQQAREFCNPRTFVEVGDAHDQILKHIQDRSVDLLVLGLRRSSHLSFETRTSRAFDLIIHATCPVLTIVG